MSNVSTTTSSLSSTTLLTTLNSTILANTTASTLTTITTTATTTISSLLSSVVTNASIISTTANSNTTIDYCLQRYSAGTCRLASFIRVLAYLLLSCSLIPQIVHLIYHGSRYIAGVSYMWIVIRVLALSSLIIAHAYKWPTFFELIALISTLVMFVQIFIYADNLHRQQKLLLIISSLATWMIGIGIMLILRKHETFLIMLGYLFLAVHMLPQVNKRNEMFGFGFYKFEYFEF